MLDLFAGWRFALHRLRAGWRFMLVAAVGVLVAASLLAAAPIYTTTMSDLGLQFRLAAGLDEPGDRVVSAEVFGLAIGDPADQARRDALAAITEARLGDLADEILIEARVGRFSLSFAGHEEEAPEEPVTPEPGELLRQPWGSFIVWSSGFEDHVEVVDGRLPVDATDADGTFEVVLPDGFQPHAVLGDVVRLRTSGFDDCQAIPGSDDPNVAREEVPCVPTTFASTTLEATIVGFVAAADPTDVRWTFLQLTGQTRDWTVPEQPLLPRIPAFGFRIGGVDDLTRRALGGEGSMPLLTTESQFFGVMGAQLPEIETRYRIGIVPDLASISLSDVSRSIDDLAAWDEDIGDRLDLVATQRIELARQLDTFRNVESFSQIPLLLILLQVVGIVLFYVVLVVNILLERQREEIGVYVARGASTAQVVGLSVVEGLVLAVPAVAAAPFLAQLAVRALGLTGTFEPITGGAALPAVLSPIAFVLAAAGAGLALVAILLSSFAAARRGIVDVKRDQARPTGRGILQRYYLDLAVVVLAGLLWWQLDQRGTVFDAESIGGWSTDPLLLLSPLVFTLAIAAMVLRFYPLLVRLTVRLLMVVPGTTVALGLRRAGRAPAAYARLMLLVVMAISVGTFAATYGPTVDRSFTERTQYAAGVPFRGETPDPDSLFRSGDLDALRAIDGVRDAALVHRGTIVASGCCLVPLLAIEVPFARSGLWFRDDFAAGADLDSLLAQLEGAAPAGGGLELPADTTRIEFEVRTEGRLAGRERVSIRATLADANGTHLNASASSVAGSGWVTSIVEVPETLVPPVRLVAFELTDRGSTDVKFSGGMVFDDIRAVSAGGLATVIEDFDDEFRWSIYRPPRDVETFERVTDTVHSGTGAARWTWNPLVTPGARRVLALDDPVLPLAALMNGHALSAFRTSVGEPALARFDDLLVSVSARAAVDLFPTMDPEVGIVVVNYEHLHSLAGAVSVRSLQVRRELWLDFEPGLSIEQQEAIVASLSAEHEPPIVILSRSVVLLSRDLQQISGDPTVQASGSGILSVAFVPVLALSTLGFVVTLVLSTRSRAVEFAVLRAVGASSWQILRAMSLEWGTVLLIGTTIGVLLGRLVASIMLSFLGITEAGARVVPPFSMVTNWALLGAGIGVLAGLVACALVAAWATTMRGADASELRITQ